ncbi:hypothetical protein OOT46_15620 [Aquabacterium sp. A7-Y]|uniref:hypothetical protein n=1 Tax=Aquabacterium sp. A7-Y TaxID=1349605 RepID=UPI00223CEBB0|nr:hypothetical protein [Aquabacterium sp. A7-Y]MCW7539273.1 hypothetical protein [Aquabacterium sp. A7-Y]
MPRPIPAARQTARPEPTVIFNSPVLSFAFAVLVAVGLAACLQRFVLRRPSPDFAARRLATLELLGQLSLLLALAGFVAGYADLHLNLRRLRTMAEASRDAEQLRGRARALLTHECASGDEDDEVFKRPKFGFCLKEATGPEESLMPTARLKPEDCPAEVDEFLQCRNYLPPQARLCSAARRLAESSTPFLETRRFGEVLLEQSRFTLCPQSGVAMDHALALIARLDADGRVAAETGEVLGNRPELPRGQTTAYLWIAVVFGVFSMALKLALALHRWKQTGTQAPGN